MRVLVVGSGGREHALAWRLDRDGAEVHAAPGNPGIAEVGACHPVRAEDAEGLLALARALRIGLVVVGPEAPLVAGIADHLRHAGIPVLGPSAAAARIEGSKAFAKDVMRAAGVPAAETMPVARPPCVVKVDGLAAGKGVFVCRTRAELDAGLRAASSYPGPIVIEELLAGEEASVFALSDGRRVIPLAGARDFKRLEAGDAGPNTGGMGAFSPVPELDVEELVERVHRPVIEELATRGTPFAGVLFAGLMLTESGPKVLEFNCRFGDPETEAIVPLVRGDLVGALEAAAGGRLDAGSLGLGPEAAVTVVAAAGEYPERGDSGSPIEGLEAARETGALVFQAGTAQRGERVVTNGGRILAVTGVGPGLAEARRIAYAALERLSFRGMRFRPDIAEEAARVGA